MPRPEDRIELSPTEARQASREGYRAMSSAPSLLLVIVAFAVIYPVYV